MSSTPATPAGMNCSVAAWIISSASPEWMRRVRETISMPISMAETAAVATHKAT